MKVSSLIEQLQQAIKTKGDVDVVLVDPHTREYRIGEVWYEYAEGEPIKIQAYARLSSPHRQE